MKLLIALFCLLCAQPLCAQQDPIPGNASFIVAAIRGQAFYQQKKLKVGDRIWYRDINAASLQMDGNSKVIFFSRHGSMPVTAALLQAVQHEVAKEKTSSMWLTANTRHGSIGHLATELLRVHPKPVSLYSRGNCECALPEECLSADAQINNKVLLIDTLSFPVHPGMTADSFFYFLQKKTPTGVHNQRLRTHNGKVWLTREDLSFDGEALPDSATFSLGLYRFVKGERKPSLVAPLQLALLSPDEVKAYYQVLREHGEAAAPEQTVEDLYTELYFFFGKPNLCQLKTLLLQNH